MNRNSSPHSSASVWALLVVPAVLMLFVAAIGGVLQREPAIHLFVVIAVGLMWRSMARRWLLKHPPDDDHKLLRACMLTLFLTLPIAVVFLIATSGYFGEIKWPFPLAMAFMLGAFPLYTFYFREWRRSR